MVDSLLTLFEGFRPTDFALSAKRAARVQVYRLLTLLGAVLFPTVGVMHKASSLDVLDPMWGRLVISGLLVGLLGLSYVAEIVRRHYVGLAYGRAGKSPSSVPAAKRGANTKMRSHYEHEGR